MSESKPKTKQDYRTPDEFMDAVSGRFGYPCFDLAATDGEQVHTADGWFNPSQDSLAQNWSREVMGETQVVWLNPPFANIAPWAEKLTRECRHLRRWTLMLVPASIGTQWFAEHVNGKALVLGLSPRLTFQGCDAPFNKDLMLVCVGFGVSGFDTWRWKQ